jgi:hypothetical protein
MIVASTLSLAACMQQKPTNDDVLAVTDTTAVYYTTKCTHPNTDGESCDRKTCKKDSRTSCARFADRCTQTGHTYEGNDDAGTCIREDHVG